MLGMTSRLSPLPHCGEKLEEEEVVALDSFFKILHLRGGSAFFLF